MMSAISSSAPRVSPGAKSLIDRSERLHVSVVLPVFEEQATIGQLVTELVSGLSAAGLTFEIVAVDDGSRDGTLEALGEARRRYPDQLRIARHLTNKGNGAALRTGIRVARGEIVVTMDADGQHSPEYISKLTELIPPYDLVIGARTHGYPGRWHRNLANRFYRAFASWLTRKRIEDLTSGFRAMRRSAVEHFLPLFPEGFSAPTTTTMAFLKAGYNVAFVPISVRQRMAGKSKIHLWKDGARFVTIILRMIMLYDPLRIFLPVGAVLGALGMAAWAAGIWNAGRLVIPNSAVFMFSAGLMIWILGFISDQISSTRVQYHGDETLLLEESSDQG
jgi:glycosyltransferase involved in cell wall biosynthesis